MNAVRIEPVILTLVGTRITYQATGDAGWSTYDMYAAVWHLSNYSLVLYVE